MKNNTGMGAGALLFLGLLFFIGMCAPNDRSSSSSSSTSDKMYIGRQTLRQELRDPDSLQIIKEEIVNGQYTAHYRAKNGFGGYTEDIYIK